MKNCVLWLAVLIVTPITLPAKRLPIKTYTTADGLARDHIRCIVQDSRGFLWFCTEEGLSRFDGYQFTTYRTEQGLPSNLITDFVEEHENVYWIATEGGVCRFDASGSGRSRFHCYPLNGPRGIPGPSVLYLDSKGGIWCGTSTSYDGVFYRGPGEDSFRHVDLRMSDATITALLIDRAGTLWVGSASGVYRRGPDGTTQSYTAADGLPNDYVMALREDRRGRLWVGTRNGLAILDFQHCRAGGRPRMRTYTIRDGLPGSRIESLLETSDGTMWVGTNEGLAEHAPSSTDIREFQSYTLAQGLTARAIGAMAEDRDGNLWIGTFGSGLMKVARNGFTTYTDADGIPVIASLVESRRGQMCVLSRPQTGLGIACFDGRRFVPIRPGWPGNLTYFGWGKGQIAEQDAEGDWWIATGQGLYRFAAVDRVEQLEGAHPKAVYGKREGLLSDNIFRVFADSHGGIWIGTIGLHGEDGLARWDRGSGRIRTFAQADGLERPVPTAFAEDRAGDIWVSLYHGGLARYRCGRFELFGAVDGVKDFINTLFVDSAGRLWVGTSSGLLRIEDPTRDQPCFERYGTAEGLSSEYIAGLTEDAARGIYAATGRGIDRFEPQRSGLRIVKHYTSADGIAPGELALALRDSQGKLWFSTSLGVSQFVVAPERQRPPPPVLIMGVRTGGIPEPVSDMGQASVSGLSLPRSPVQIDFLGLGFSPGESLRYQYMLEGVERTWSAPISQRTVIYANLSPASYHFLVRAVSSGGMVSSQPASVAFTILPPFWRTWWFLSVCATAIIMMIYSLHRYRVAQLLAVANIRTRIATDLHDDIGASLSQIAILSEVAQTGADGNRPPLLKIASISRELVDSMSDIVWAIAPDHDRLSDLISRMRRFANDVLGAHDMALDFRFSIEEHELKIGADVRRQLYLVFKEGINNIVRHSGASRVEIEFDRAGNRLSLRLRDDGKGFDPKLPSKGHGLGNMRRRATALGGTLDIDSAAGAGTTVRMTVRLGSGTALAALRGK